MEFRPADRSDVDEIVSFTTDTFEWGDYVPEMIGEWIDDPSSVVMVALDGSEIVALARVVFVTDAEVWSHAARVRSDHRGRGIAGDLAVVLLDWARNRGARVARLLIEDDNEASIRNVTKTGFRRVATAIRAKRAIGEATPNPDGNGGRRRPSAVAARPVKAADASMLAAAWSSSRCGRPLRGLVADGWRFHTLNEPDLIDAVHDGVLWEIGSSWAVTRQDDAMFDVCLLDTSPAEALDAIQTLIDVANERGSEDFWMWIADVDWLVQAARRAGCEVVPYGIWVYSL
jgi:RimJ/RimL family protein N-acetyltransferase